MQLKKNDKYYVVCPTNVITGGPDALHQMVYYMTEQGFNCKIAYLADKKRGLKIPEPYQVYISDYTIFRNIKDITENTVIIPETFSFLARKFKHAKVYIWWLSVDNNTVDLSFTRRLIYFISSPFRILKHKTLYKSSVLSKISNTVFCHEYSFDNERENVAHLCASYYALDIIGNKTQRPVYKCIEPISFLFLEKYRNEKENCTRGDLILFNPKKSREIVNKLKLNYPLFEFMPLENLTQCELIETYKRSKLYIDFGPFPGAERIPKEAVLYGCLIITGRKGASNYYGDVPIPDYYKFKDDDLENIAMRINYCLNNYESCYHDFDKYRSIVLDLESNFKENLNYIFASNNYHPANEIVNDRN